MRMFAIIVAACLLANTQIAQAQSPPPGGEYKQYLRLGQAFYAAGDYDAAVSEYKRALLLSPKDRSYKIALDLGLSHYHSRQYGKSLTLLGKEFPNSRECHTKTKNPDLCLDVLVLRSKSLLRTDEHQLAATVLSEALQSAATIKSTSKTDDLRMLTAFNLLYLERRDKALTTLATVEKSKSTWHQQNATQAITMINNNPPKEYSSKLAATLSIIPGLGQLYSGHRLEAFASFLINGTLFYMASEAFRRKRDIPSYGSAPAIGWSAAFLSFYTGNMYNAADLAREATNDSSRNLLNRVSAFGYYQLLDN